MKKQATGSGKAFFSKLGTSCNIQAKGNLALGIEKLIEYGRPYAAIDCLGAMLHDNQQPDTTLCVQALRSALSSKEPCSMMARYHIVELIKFLQAAPLLNLDDIFEIEWNYLPLLEGNKDAVPKFLESRLANDPEFFCEAIRLSYRTKKIPCIGDKRLPE